MKCCSYKNALKGNFFGKKAVPNWFNFWTHPFSSQPLSLSSPVPWRVEEQWGRGRREVLLRCVLQLWASLVLCKNIIGDREVKRVWRLLKLKQHEGSLESEFYIIPLKNMFCTFKMYQLFMLIRSSYTKSMCK